ncbi:hypothetical protein [Thermodesulfitimonas autotrophica]|uniref:hypothetical protein n=1 Tax=Thermodesulfitimonas autotrophica TaxID=1894989 RepID=UPI002FE2E1DF
MPKIRVDWPEEHQEFKVSSGTELAESIRRYTRDRGISPFIVETRSGQRLTPDGLAKAPLYQVKEVYVRRYYGGA